MPYAGQIGQGRILKTHGFCHSGRNHNSGSREHGVQESHPHQVDLVKAAGPKGRILVPEGRDVEGVEDPVDVFDVIADQILALSLRWEQCDQLRLPEDLGTHATTLGQLA